VRVHTAVDGVAGFGKPATWNAVLEFDLASNSAWNFQYGFRFCKCDKDLATPQGRVGCDISLDCPMAGEWFDSQTQENRWKQIHLDGALPAKPFQSFFNPVSGSIPPLVGKKLWDIRDDPGLQEPSSPENPASISTHGLLWGHALKPDLAAVLTKQGGDVGSDPTLPRLHADRANVYTDGSVRVSFDKPGFGPGDFPQIELPNVEIFPPPPFCGNCSLGNRRPYLWLDPADPAKVVGILGKKGWSLSSVVSADAAQVLRAASGQLLYTNEPGSILQARNDGGWTMAHLTDDLALDTTLGVGPEGLVVKGRRVSPRAALAPQQPAFVGPPPAVKAGLVAIATKDAVVRVGGLINGSPSQDIWWLDVSTKQWTSTPLQGNVRPGAVLASTYRYSDDSIYVLDEVKKGWLKEARLLRIRRGAIVEQVASWTRLLDSDLTLSTSDLDELVFTFSKGNAHAVLVANVSHAGKLVPRAWTLKPGHVVKPSFLTTQWLTELVKHGQQLEATELERTALWPAIPSSCKEWW
jgi:hypothetical protein